ncbi:MAG: hypothetical protein HY719_09510 [Planctomycetes bacterium]|nr:hypothetical protein [Planctomycetota bacterium]
MPIPLILGVCEDEVERDLTFLKAFAGNGADLRLTPTHGGTPAGKEARILKRQFDDAKRAGFSVCAFLIHRDADRASLNARENELRKWYSNSELGSLNVPLIRCVPNPCTETWLCAMRGLRGKNANPAAGGKPWKRAWEKKFGHTLDPVREAAAAARQKLATRDDFARFMTDWTNAGLT